MSTQKPMPTSPRSPLDMKIIQPTPTKRLPMKKNYDLHGVGLGIVVALDKSGEIPATSPLFLQNIWRSHPIPLNKNYFTTKNPNKKMPNFDFDHSSSSSEEEEEEEEEEEYTYVTRRDGPNKLCTRVYCDGIEQKKRIVSTEKNRESVFCSIFDISPARYSDDSQPDSDFLKLCNLCKKKLHGKDVYIYRGEKGFCSPECRHSQIMMDMKREKQYSNNFEEKTRSRNHYNQVDFIKKTSRTSSSAYSNLQIILSPEIFAT